MHASERPAADAAVLWWLIPLECYVVGAAIFISAACELLLPFR